MPQELFAAVEAWPLAAALRLSRWGYAAVNAAHILGIALLVGSIVPLDLRLMGAWRSVPHQVLARILVPVAVAGLAIAVAAGALLFATRAGDYADLAVFQVKLALIATGASTAIALHTAYGIRLGRAPVRHLRVAGLVSMASWIGALICGRMIAFAGD